MNGQSGLMREGALKENQDPKNNQKNHKNHDSQNTRNSSTLWGHAFLIPQFLYSKKGDYYGTDISWRSDGSWKELHRAENRSVRGAS